MKSLETLHEFEYRKWWKRTEREHLWKTEKKKQTGVTHSMKGPDLKGGVCGETKEGGYG
jgi:hypothetical protein